MPTPSPIIVASVGAIEGTVAACPRITIKESPATSPSTAETIGKPIATSVPKVNARMTIAAAIPITSLLSVSAGESLLPTEPPTATCRPAFTPGLPASRTLCAMSSVRVSPLTSSSTGMYAVRPSLLIWDAPLWLKGSTALATCGSSFTREYEASIACLLSESVTFSPTGAWKTSGLLPFCRGGNWAASRLLAAWLSVPGRLRLSLVFAPMR